MQRNLYMILRGVLAAIMLGVFWPAATTGEPYGSPIQSKVDLSYLVNGRRPIWMGPVIRYTVYEKTTVEARISALTGELVLVMPLGEQEPGQYTLPWDGTTDGGLATFDGKYFFELFFGDEYATKFWLIAKPLQTFDESS
jgi:hypothetical protein